MTAISCASTTGAGPSGIVRDSNLIFYYDAALSQSYPGTGTTWTNLAGGVNLGSPSANTPTFGSSGFFTFNGTTQYANCATNTNFTLTAAAGFSLFLWVYPSSDGILSNMTGGSQIISPTGYHAVMMDIISTGVFRVGLWNGTAVTTVATTAQSFNNWYNIGLTYGSSTLTGYLNGTSLGTSSFTWIPPGSNSCIGICAPDSTIITGGVNAYGDARISTVLGYNRALTSAEVIQNYQATRGRFGV